MSIIMQSERYLLQQPLQQSDIKKTYIVNLEKDEDNRVVVTCPELPGVVTDGENEDEAIKNAYEAVAAMLESLGRKEEFNLIISQKN